MSIEHVNSQSDWIYQPAGKPSIDFIKKAQNHQRQLTKPPGSLAQLEDIAVQFCGWQATLSPKIEGVSIVIFAGDHGVCAQNISAFPQAVTTQMLANFSNGGAAISVLAQEMGADFSAVNLGTTIPVPSALNVVDRTIASSTKDFTVEAAMTITQCEQALLIGREFIIDSTAKLHIAGEMGIGNTSSAAAITSAVLKCPPSFSVGRGTGIDDKGLLRKQQAVQAGLDLHEKDNQTPLDVLRNLGGLEIAALVGFYIASAQKRVPAMVDGYICTSAALIATRLNPSVRPWLIFSHCSAEPAHKMLLEALKAVPLLDLGLRLGEGSGAALCVPLIKSALALHNKMATFEQANVSQG